MIDSKTIKKCLACESTNLDLVLDLKEQPLANSFVKTPSIQQVFPLILIRCFSCGHLQLSECVSRKQIFSDYIYRSATTQTLQKYFQWFAQEITKRHGVGRILDIACNDGAQLDCFRELGWETFGVDPAENLSQFNKHPHKVAFFDDSCLELGKFDVIIAQNVLAHTDTPDIILSTAGKMSDNIYIQTSQARMIERNEFDTIYHEHLSFFSPNSMSRLAVRCGLQLQSFEIAPIHGDSFIFHLSKSRVSRVFETWSPDAVQYFAKNVSNTISQLQFEFSNETRIIGYGAAAKAMTLLNAVGLGPKYIIDDAPEKIGLFSPGLNIPVLNVKELANETAPILLMPLAWNFTDEIVARVRNQYSGPLRLLKFFPKVGWEWQQ